MNTKLRFTLSSILWVIALLAAYSLVAHAQSSETNQPSAKKGAVQINGAGTAPVSGSGIVGRLSKWLGQAKNTWIIGESVVYEDEFGKVGIGTDNPTSKLTVQGMIETTLGGYKFPDGSVQTTAATSGLSVIYRDGSLTGNGTEASPLGVRVPLFLVASQEGGTPLEATGGDLQSSQGFGGEGLNARGGDALNANGGRAGSGVFVVGGNSYNQNSAGAGVATLGGNGVEGGPGVYAIGGGPLINGQGHGGAGIRAFGGGAKGANRRGGEGIYAQGGAGTDGALDGLAGLFQGAVQVAGNFNVTNGGTKNFKIDHPLDPENKYLYHAAMESSEVLNLYSGNVTTDENGTAVVKLPDWFESLNRDFRYQLTAMGAPAQGLYIAEKINNNRFKIAGGQPGMEISWQVTGIRSDPAMRIHPFKVEEDKPKAERGSYLSPEAYDQPEDRGINWIRNRQSMEQLKQQRLEIEERRKQQ